MRRRVLTVTVIFVSLTVAVSGAFELAYRQKIYPGITLAQVSLGNLTVDQASQKLAANLIPQPLILVWGTSSWTVSPQSLGLEYDPGQSAQQAYLVGRQGPLWSTTNAKVQAFSQGKAVSPVFSWQENQLQEAMASISGQINIPAREPEVQIDQGQVIILPGENGQAVDERLLRLRIGQAIINLSTLAVEIPVSQLQPKLSPDQAEAMRQRAEKLLSKKLALVLESSQWEIASDQIFSWLDPSPPAGGSGQGGWNRPAIATWVSQLATSIDRPAQNALFKYVGSGKVEEFKPAQAGLTVQPDALVTQIISSLDKLETAVPVTPLTIPVSITPPQVATGEVNGLGITELIGRGESNFTGSIPNRIFNIKKAAGSMNGVLVAPGDTFSFAKYVGDISAETGYKQAYVIKEGKTILGDGGGVCQVSTTLFRAVLNAGLPIVERTAHAYRVHYYENDSGPGLDATVFTPSVDFKFQNDTPAYILIQTSVDEPKKKLYFDLYGTGDGRTVTISKPKVWDVTPPPPDLYTNDPTLPKGTVKQVDFKAWGAKVSFDYKVTRGDEVLQSRTFYSNYRPWQAVFLRGPQI
mgnify:CR=1 FL=1